MQMLFADINPIAQNNVGLNNGQKCLSAEQYAVKVELCLFG